MDRAKRVAIAKRLSADILKDMPRAMNPTTTEKRTHQHLLKLNDQENVWATELAVEAGTSVQTVMRTLLREEMRRRRKRGER